MVAITDGSLKKFVIFGKEFIVREKDLKNPKLHDIKKINSIKLLFVLNKINCFFIIRFIKFKFKILKLVQQNASI